MVLGLGVLAGSLGSTLPALAGTGAAAAGTGAAAAGGAGLGSVLGLLGQGIGGLGSAAGNIFGIIQAGRGRDENAAWRDWQRTKEPIATAMQRLYYNPAYTGRLAPGFQEPSIVSQLEPGQTLQEKYAYRWSPTASTSRLYDSYLQREYGLSDVLARSIASQALSPLKAGALPASPFTATQAQGLFQSDPETLANVQIGLQTPEVLRQLNYLQNAGQLASFNLGRVQQLPSLIG